MNNFYEDPKAAQAFAEFANSENGRQQQKILLEAILKRLPRQENQQILDAACGTGWLTAELNKRGRNIQGFDSSAGLINAARQKFPQLRFELADASGALPYPKENFDCIILNMAAHDLADQPAAFANLYSLLKSGGLLLVTIANPYYAYPVGVWKRGLWRFLFGLKPLLRLRPYNFFMGQKQSGYEWKKNMLTRFYPLSAYINNLLRAGFTLSYFEELAAEAAGKNFDANYQLFRFPLLLLLELRKA